MFTKGAGKVHKEGNVDPRTLHYEDQDVQLGHWPVSVLMNGYSGFIAQLHRIKQVGQRLLRAGAGPCASRVLSRSSILCSVSASPKWLCKLLGCCNDLAPTRPPDVHCCRCTRWRCT